MPIAKSQSTDRKVNQAHSILSDGYSAAKKGSTEFSVNMPFGKFGDHGRTVITVALVRSWAERQGISVLDAGTDATDSTSTCVVLGSPKQ